MSCRGRDRDKIYAATHTANLIYLSIILAAGAPPTVTQRAGAPPTVTQRMRPGYALLYVLLHWRPGAGMDGSRVDEKALLIAPGIDPGEETIVEAPLFYSGPAATVASRRDPDVWRSKGWLYATVILCCYGFFKEFKASEPFLTPYLVDYKNFTKDQVCSYSLPLYYYTVHRCITSSACHP